MVEAEVLANVDCEPQGEDALDLRVIRFTDDPERCYPVLVDNGTSKDIADFLDDATELARRDGKEVEANILCGGCLGVITLTKDKQDQIVGYSVGGFDGFEEAHWWNYIRTPSEILDKRRYIQLAKYSPEVFETLKQIFILRERAFDNPQELSVFRDYVEEKVGTSDELDEFLLDIGNYLAPKKGF